MNLEWLIRSKPDRFKVITRKQFQLAYSDPSNKTHDRGTADPSNGQLEMPLIVTREGLRLSKPDPAWRKSVISLAEAQLRHERPADAIPGLITLCHTDEKDHYASRLLALAFAKTDRWEDARKILDKMAGHKAGPDTKFIRTWSKIKRLAYVAGKLSTALISYGIKRIGDLRK